MINQYLLAGSVQSSTVASGGPRWWSVNNTMKPTTTFHPHHHHHHQFTESANLASSSWNDDNPQSWNQALVGGLMFADEDTYKLQSSRIHTMQENNIPPLNPPAGLIIPIQDAKTSKSLWCRHQMIHSPSSDQKSCSYLNDSKLDGDRYAHISSNGKRPRNESPYSPESKSNAKGGSAAKKARVIQHSLDQSTFKVRKEKLGDRITALHQIVSPFGKTDTASVLLESIGYIRFLQNQIEALSLPYLNCAKSKSMRQQHTGISDEEEQKNKDLRSRGLCLVPIECTFHVGGDNMGADYWASAFSAR